MTGLPTLVVAAIVGLASTGMATAQGYPTRPITMVVRSPPAAPP